MKVKDAIRWVAVAVSIAMPFTVINMVEAYLENGSALTRASLIEVDMVRLSQLSGDVRSLPAVDGSLLLTRHGLSSSEALQQRIKLAQTTFAQTRADVENTARRVWRNTAIGFFCVAISSWLAVTLAIVLPRKRADGSAASA
ncbi:hypothetical protein [Paraburkholderia sp. RL17-373-BIF-A]|uniref:hypothetical protein n=1 Tax=Paraburkholderia sp. RL17-373-BIF-A TaxID=3031629 RepID=UPI0038B9CEB9